MYTLVKFKLYTKSSFIFKPSKVPTKIYSSSWAYISFKIYVPHKENSPPSPRGTTAPPEGRAPQFGNLCYNYSVEWKGSRWMMNCKGSRRKLPWATVKVLSRNLPGGTWENHENLKIAGLRAEVWTRDLTETNQVFSTRPRRLVCI
jgi:hypothetical protein